MKKLHDRVNLIPVIAKADTMTPDEIKQFKATVLNVIAEQKLQIYEFPDIDDDDAENHRTNNVLKVRIFVVVVRLSLFYAHNSFELLMKIKRKFNNEGAGKHFFNKKRKFFYFRKRTYGGPLDIFWLGYKFFLNRTLSLVKTLLSPKPKTGSVKNI